MCVVLDVAFVGFSTATTSRSAPGLASEVVLLVITQFSVHYKIRFISQLVNGISNVLQKLLKCFNGTTISTFSFSVFSNFPVILVLQSKNFESLIEFIFSTAPLFVSSLQ